MRVRSKSGEGTRKFSSQTLTVTVSTGTDLDSRGDAHGNTVVVATSRG